MLTDICLITHSYKPKKSKDREHVILALQEFTRLRAVKWTTAVLMMVLKVKGMDLTGDVCRTTDAREGKGRKEIAQCFSGRTVASQIVCILTIGKYQTFKRMFYFCELHRYKDHVNLPFKNTHTYETICEFKYF